MTFASRQDAGMRLGLHLRDHAVETDVVLGLPRGGVVVAAEVAHILHRPLDLLVVRKIGHPLHREYAVGALAEDDVVIFDSTALSPRPTGRAELNRVIAEETGRMLEYERKFHAGGRLDLAGKSVLIVDDGLATGATTEAAVWSARKRNAREVRIAAPVASPNAVQRLDRVADGVFVLIVDPEFEAVGRYYDVFTQTTDEEVLEVLKSEAAAK